MALAQVFGGGRRARGVSDGTPDWWQGQPLNEWIEISGTSGAGGAAIDAWGALVLVTDVGGEPAAMLVSSANGGHADSSDNRVVSLDLLADAPSWTTQISASSSVTSDVSHYADGKPVSRHGYAYAHYISQRGKIMLFGARGIYSSGGDSLKVDAHTVSGTWSWDAADTHTATPSGVGYASAHDTTTGNVITNGGRIWTEATGEWTSIADFGGGGRYPVACAAARGEFFSLQWGDGGPDSGSSGVTAKRFALAGNAGSTITFNASAAYTQFQADAPFYAGLDYDPENDRYLFYDGVGAKAGRVYVITPNAGTTWDMSILSLTGTTPDATVSAGINKRFLYVPALKGFVLAPQQSSNLFFFKVA